MIEIHGSWLWLLNLNLNLSAVCAVECECGSMAMWDIGHGHGDGRSAIRNSVLCVPLVSDSVSVSHTHIAHATCWDLGSRFEKVTQSKIAKRELRFLWYRGGCAHVPFAFWNFILGVWCWSRHTSFYLQPLAFGLLLLAFGTMYSDLHDHCISINLAANTCLVSCLFCPLSWSLSPSSASILTSDQTPSTEPKK